MLLDILNLLDRQLGMVRGAILLLAADGTERIFEAEQWRPTAQRRDVRHFRGEGIAGRVVQTGESAVIPRVSEEPLLRERVRRRQDVSDEEVSFLCVPITLGGEVVGTLSVEVRYDESERLDRDERVLRVVAGMIAGDVKTRRTINLLHETHQAETLRLRSALAERFRPESIIGNSKAMREVYTWIHRVSGGDTTVLIQGEPGTGKELIASAVHYASHRSKQPLVKVNCGLMSEAALESELFGHESGAFAGAMRSRVGRIEQAEGGSLFLDEVGSLSPVVQVKLLRVLQDRQYERVGGNETRQANVRVVAATHSDLAKAVQAGRFREDLYYRINVLPITLPPLRERRSDLLLLANHFTEIYSRKTGKEIRRISTPAINMIMTYHWPGNVRELENCIEHAVLLAKDGVIHGHNLPPTLQTPDTSEAVPPDSLKARTRMLERDMITDALKRTQGNMSAAARELGITPRMIRYKIKKLDIDYQGIFKRRTE